MFWTLLTCADQPGCNAFFSFYILYYNVIIIVLADIFLYSYEAEFIQSLLSIGMKRLASQFNFTYRYTDGVKGDIPYSKVISPTCRRTCFCQKWYHLELQYDIILILNKGSSFINHFQYTILNLHRGKYDVFTPEEKSFFLNMMGKVNSALNWVIKRNNCFITCIGFYLNCQSHHRHLVNKHLRNSWFQSSFEDIDILNNRI